MKKPELLKYLQGMITSKTLEELDFFVVLDEMIRRKTAKSKSFKEAVVDIKATGRRFIGDVRSYMSSRITKHGDTTKIKPIKVDKYEAWGLLNSIMNPDVSGISLYADFDLRVVDCSIEVFNKNGNVICDVRLKTEEDCREVYDSVNYRPKHIERISWLVQNCSRKALIAALDILQKDARNKK